MSAFNKLPSFAGTTWVTAFKSRLIIDSDDSHQLKINLNGTVQTLATLAQTQTLTNKTFTSPTINDAEVSTFGTFSSTAGTDNLALSASVTTAVGVYADDVAASVSSATWIKALRGRLLLGFQGTQECEAAGTLGQLIVKDGTTLGHNDAGVWGSWEVNGTGTVVTAGTSSDNIHAGVLGRVGLGASGTLTVNANSILAGVAAMSNVNSGGTRTYTGIYAGFYAGAWASADDFEYGIYIAEAAHAAYFNCDLGTISGEEHGVSAVVTGTLSSGDSMVGENIAVTTAGTAASWVSGIYAKVTQGSTKNVNGYISGAEFEVVNSANNVSDNFVLVLNSNNSGSTRGSHESYIALRSYGSLAGNSFLWVEDQTIGADDDVTSLVAANNPTAATHTLRMIVDDTPYWFMLCNQAGLGS